MSFIMLLYTRHLYLSIPQFYNFGSIPYTVSGRAIWGHSQEEHSNGEGAVLSRRTKRLKIRDPIAAIAELNKMERIGAASDPGDGATYHLHIHVGTAEGEDYRCALNCP